MIWKKNFFIVFNIKTMQDWKLKNKPFLVLKNWALIKVSKEFAVISFYFVTFTTSIFLVHYFIFNSYLGIDLLKLVGWEFICQNLFSIIILAIAYFKNNLEYIGNMLYKWAIFILNLLIYSFIIYIYLYLIFDIDLYTIHTLYIKYRFLKKWLVVIVSFMFIFTRNWGKLWNFWVYLAIISLTTSYFISSFLIILMEIHGFIDTLCIISYIHYDNNHPVNKTPEIKIAKLNIENVSDKLDKKILESTFLQDAFGLLISLSNPKSYLYQESSYSENNNQNIEPVNLVDILDNYLEKEIRSLYFDYRLVETNRFNRLSQKYNKCYFDFYKEEIEEGYKIYPKSTKNFLKTSSFNIHQSYWDERKYWVKEIGPLYEEDITDFGPADFHPTHPAWLNIDNPPLNIHEMYSREDYFFKYGISNLAFAQVNQMVSAMIGKMFANLKPRYSTLSVLNLFPYTTRTQFMLERDDNPFSVVWKDVDTFEECPHHLLNAMEQYLQASLIDASDTIKRYNPRPFFQIYFDLRITTFLLHRIEIARLYKNGHFSTTQLCQNLGYKNTMNSSSSSKGKWDDLMIQIRSKNAPINSWDWLVANQNLKTKINTNKSSIKL